MRRSLATIIGAALAAQVGVAHAVSGEASILWDQFSALVIPLPPSSSAGSVTFSDQATLLEVGAQSVQAANFSDPLSLSSGSFQAGATAAALIAQLTGPLSGELDASSRRSQTFTAPANSLVVFSVKYNVSTDATGLLPGQSFSALAGLGWSSISAGVTSGSEQKFGWTDASGSLSQPGTFEVYFVNLSTQAATGSVYAFASVSSVPEPQTYLMFAAGGAFLMLSLAARRHRAGFDRALA